MLAGGARGVAWTGVVAPPSAKFPPPASGNLYASGVDVEASRRPACFGSKEIQLPPTVSTTRLPWRVMVAEDISPRAEDISPRAEGTTPSRGNHPTATPK
jgi:hypothetical protein